jgi:hypothetical protein
MLFLKTIKKFRVKLFWIFGLAKEKKMLKETLLIRLKGELLIRLKGTRASSKQSSNLRLKKKKKEKRNTISIFLKKKIKKNFGLNFLGYFSYSFF